MGRLLRPIAPPRRVAATARRIAIGSTTGGNRGAHASAGPPPASPSIINPPSHESLSSSPPPPLPSPSFSPSGPPLQYLLTCEYVGTAFHGSSGLNTGHPTVQLALSRALSRVLHQPISLTLAGRTDASVHALCMPATFTIPPFPPPPPTPRLLFLCNQALYHERHSRHLHVISLSRVSPSFHPRFSALSRVYLYRLITGPPLLFHHHRAWHLPYPLHLPSMRTAASLLLGTHDFASLISHRSSDRRSTIRTLTSIEVRGERAEGRVSTQVVELRFEAPSFLHRQVRNVVAALVEVGRGRMRAEEVGRLLQGVERSRNPLTPAPPYGLFLHTVRYDEQLMRQWLMPDENGVASEAQRGKAAAAYVWKLDDFSSASGYLWRRAVVSSASAGSCEAAAESNAVAST